MDSLPRWIELGLSFGVALAGVFWLLVRRDEAVEVRLRSEMKQSSDEIKGELRVIMMRLDDRVRREDIDALSRSQAEIKGIQDKTRDRVHELAGKSQEMMTDMSNELHKLMGKVDALGAAK